MIAPAIKAARNCGMIATGNHLYLDSLRGAPPYVPNPARIARVAEHLNDGASTAKMFRFLLRWGRVLRDGRAKVGTLSRHIAKTRLTAGLGGVVHRRGRLCEKPPPMAASFGSFLADARKEYVSNALINDNLFYHTPKKKTSRPGQDGL